MAAPVCRAFAVAGGLISYASRDSRRYTVRE
jgi:hypothetical protein